MKVHAKLIVIRRKQSGKNIYYSNISTGNFNESTAKVYSDFSLLTANQKIGRDINTFFQLIENRYIPPKMNLLEISPFHIRNFFEEKIKREIKNKKQGKEAWFIIKVNNLVDDNIAKLIYDASNNGVKSDLIIRGINVMETAVPNFSQNVNAFSIVGRFLEHARVFIFANAGNIEVFISSADIMSRNMDFRFEIICPILDDKAKTDILSIIKLQQNDTEKYRSLNIDEINKYTRKNSGLSKVNSQLETYNYWKENS